MKLNCYVCDKHNPKTLHFYGYEETLPLFSSKSYKTVGGLVSFLNLCLLNDNVGNLITFVIDAIKGCLQEQSILYRSSQSLGWQIGSVLLAYKDFYTGY